MWCSIIATRNLRSQRMGGEQMKVLIFLILYILIGCIIDLLITKGENKPNLVLAMVWPFFLLITVSIVIIEMLNEAKN